MAHTPASIVVTDPDEPVRAVDVAEQIDLDLHHAAANPTTAPLPLATDLPSGESPALVELEPLPDGPDHHIHPAALGQRNDGAHISIVKDSKGHFFTRILHSTASASASASRRKKKKHHHKSSQPTYGLGHSKGAPVIIRAGQDGYPSSFPGSAPVSRINSRKEVVQGGETGGAQSTGTNTPAPRRSYENHHHARPHQDPHHLIGLGRANPLSGLVGTANPNRPFQQPSSSSSTTTPHQGLSRVPTANGRRSLDSAPFPSQAPPPALTDAEIGRIAAALGTASPPPPPPNSINPELLIALRDIIREEVGSAHAVHAEKHQQQIVDEIQALRDDDAESDPLTENTLSITDVSSSKQQQQQQHRILSPPSQSIRAERGIEEETKAEKGLANSNLENGEKIRPSSGSAKSSVSSTSALVAQAAAAAAAAAKAGSISSSSSTDLENGSDSEELQFPNPWAKFRYTMREPFAEFLGTCVFIIFGNGVNNQVFVSQMYDASAPKGDYLSVSFGWGIGVAFGIWIAGGISGGHLNPCVTLALAVYRGFPWRKVPVYIVSQILGATTGALLIYGLYCNPIRVVDPNQTETTAALFTTFPADYLRKSTTRPTAFYNEVLATAVLLIIVLAIGDAANTPPPDGLAPLALMWAVVGLGATLGWQTAYALNIARDLGPRIALAIVGYSPDVLWSFNAYYFLWTPMLGAVVGALLGGFIYDALLYTGGESPLNRAWKWSDVRWARHSKKKLPAGISA